ncbi:MAG: hypothetical protein AAB922_05655 [Patescibacteria group bacterium]
MSDTDKMISDLAKSIEECARLRAALAEKDAALVAAQAKAEQYSADWYAAKSEFGESMAKMRAVRDAAEKERDAAQGRVAALHKALNDLFSGVIAVAGREWYGPPERGDGARADAAIAACNRAIDDTEAAAREHDAAVGHEALRTFLGGYLADLTSWCCCSVGPAHSGICAAAREWLHTRDEAVRAQAFEEAAKIAQGCGGLLASDAGYLAELNHVGLAKHIAAALREKARKP